LEIANDTKVPRRTDFNFDRHNSDLLDSIPTNDNLPDARMKGTGFSDDKRFGRDISNCKFLLK
jgi:hypothetical protein